MAESDSTPILNMKDQSTQVDFPHYKDPRFRNIPRLRHKLQHSKSAYCLAQTVSVGTGTRSWSQSVNKRPRSLALLQRDLSSDSMMSCGSWERYPNRSISRIDNRVSEYSNSSYQQYTPPPHYQTKQNSGLSMVETKRQHQQHQNYDHNPNLNPECSLEWRHLHRSKAKLKATATTSELLSGFAMIAMVELQVNEHSGAPQWLIVGFAVSTTILVSVHIFALMVSTYLLPQIEAASKLSSSRALTESPHARMRGFIELAWMLSTVLGLFLFLLEIAILSWVKFWDFSIRAATAATAIVIPVLAIFVAFALYFHWSMVVRKFSCGRWGRGHRKDRSGRDSPV